MEIQELKDQFNKASVHYSRQELNDIFEVRMKSTVDQVNKKMLWDAVLMLVVAGGLIMATFLIGLKQRYWVSGEILVVSLLLLLHYRIKYYLLNRFDFEGNVMQALMRCKKRLLFYMKVYWGVVPSSIGILYLSIQTGLVGYPAMDDPGSILRFSLVFPIVWVLFVITKKLTQFLYGEDITHLNGLIKEMEFLQDH